MSLTNRAISILYLLPFVKIDDMLCSSCVPKRFHQDYVRFLF